MLKLRLPLRDGHTVSVFAQFEIADQGAGAKIEFQFRFSGRDPGAARGDARRGRNGGGGRGAGEVEDLLGSHHFLQLELYFRE